MVRPSKQSIIIGCDLLLGCASVWGLNARSANRPREARFWFGPVTARDLETIAWPMLVRRLGDRDAARTMR